MNLPQNLFERPAVYQKTAAAFWEDEYISSQMLQNHLNPETEGASRKLTFIEESVAFICQTLPPADYPKLLDLGCGPGIYSELLAKAGYQVTGVDFSKRSIAYAKQAAIKQQLAIDYQQQNYLSLNLPEKYDLIIMIYCDFGALSTMDRKRVLQKMLDHLKLGGKTLFDVFSLNKFQQIREAKDWHYVLENGFWSAEPYLELQQTLIYPQNITLEQSFILQENQLTPYNIWTTFFDQHSLANEWAQYPVKICDWFSDVAGHRDFDQQDTLAVLLEKTAD
ncbi:class I SAM-dependent methyltransferase [Enterococcus sp. LJL90]